jgi:protein-tyrosine phosphatase
MVPLNLNGHIFYVSSRPGYYDGFAAAPHDCKDFVKEMKAREIRFVVVLMPESEMEQFYGMNLCDYYEKNGIKSYHYAIEDHCVPTDLKSFHEMIETIWKHLETENALVHCFAGIGRTGMVAAAVLIYGEGEDASSATSVVRRVRPRAVETEEQESFLEKYSSFVLSAKAAAFEGNLTRKKSSP